MPTLERLKAVENCFSEGRKMVHSVAFGYKICSVNSLNIVWKKHEKMETSILHIYKSNLGPSTSDGSNTMDGSNLFESPANFPYIFKIKEIFRSNTDTSNSRTSLMVPSIIKSRVLPYQTRTSQFNWQMYLEWRLF